jgi:hypothetical protein
MPIKSQPKRLAEQLSEMLNPSEETLYNRPFEKEIWSLDDFCALMGGLSPEKYKQIQENSNDVTLTHQNLKQALDANKICTRFFKQYDELRASDNIRMVDSEIYMSPWRFIKWVAANGIQIKHKFLNALPIYLVELYLEFMPTNSALRTKSKYSLAYHKALYLKNAQKLIASAPGRLTREFIYSDPGMQSVLRQIRQLGGNYTKRTIKDSWLAKLENLKKGRPKKYQPPKQLNSTE